MIRWRNNETKKRDEKKKREAHKGIKTEFWCVWQNRKSLLWVSNAPFNNLFLEFIILHFTFFSFSTAADFQMSFMMFCIGVWCVFPIALRTIISNENLCEHVRNLAMNWKKRAPDDSIKAIPFTSRLLTRFVYYFFRKSKTFKFSSRSEGWCRRRPIHQI